MQTIDTTSTSPLASSHAGPVENSTGLTIRPTADAAQIKAAGLESLRRLNSDDTFEDWTAVARVLQLITDEAMRATHASEWSPLNKALVKEVSRRWDLFEKSLGSNSPRPLTKQEKSALRIILKPEVIAMRERLALTTKGDARRKLNHPVAIMMRWNAEQKKKQAGADGGNVEPKMTSLQTANASIAKLEEENHRLRKQIEEEDFDGFNKSSTIAATITAIAGKFDGLSSKASRLDGIGRGLVKLAAELKKQGPKPPTPPMPKKPRPQKGKSATASFGLADGAVAEQRVGNYLAT